MGLRACAAMSPWLLSMAYGGQFMLRTPGVGVVRKYAVPVLVSVALVAVAGWSCVDCRDEADEASLALVNSKPSG